ncbi:Nn.00g000330.m01.CDS01 [Neocucurbitaria sp. VM-36]
MSLPRTANLKWCPQHLHARFDGFYQYQDLDIEIDYPGSPEPVTVPLRRIIDPDLRRPITFMDINIKTISLSRLEQRIKDLPSLNEHSPKDHVVQYPHPDEEDVTVSIYDDESLRSGLTTLRKEMTYK